MYRHFLEYGNTASEDVSPSGYFDDQYYLEQKTAQANAMDPTAGWTVDKMEAAIRGANLSCWEHYTQYGMYETLDGARLNPSAYFDTQAYMEAKLAQAISVDPDGGWTMDKLNDTFAADHLNPIMHWFLYGINENLGNFGYTPAAAPTPPVIYNEFIPLTLADGETLTGAADKNTLFNAVVSNGDDNTLNNTDVINGGGGDDNGLSVDMYRSFSGFKGVEQSDGTVGPNVTDIDHVYLTNARPRGSVNFNAKNMDGVKDWVLDSNNSGAINLSELAAPGVEITVKNLASGSSSIDFADGATDGNEDTMTLGLDNVGSKSAVEINGLSGIEELVIQNDNGSSSVDLSQIAPESIAVTGGGNTTITAVSSALKSFDASAAVGNVSANLTKAASSFESIKGGEGDDTFIIDSAFRNNATIDGGEGTDTVEITGSSVFNASPSWESIENIYVNTASAKIGAKLIEDLDTVTVKNATLADINEIMQSEIAVVDKGNNGSTVKVNGYETIDNNGQATSELDAVTYTQNIPSSETQARVVNTKLDTNAGGSFTAELGSLKMNGNELSTFDGILNAVRADEYTVTANGNLGANAVFNAQTASEIAITAMQGSDFTDGITLITGNGSDANVTLTSWGDIKYDGNTIWDGVTSLTINQGGGRFATMPDVSPSFAQMANVSNIDVNGMQGTEGTKVYLNANVGSATFNQDVNVDVNNVENFLINSINTLKNIDVTVSNGSGNVALNYLNAGNPTDGLSDINVTIGTVGGVNMGSQATFAVNGATPGTLEIRPNFYNPSGTMPFRPSVAGDDVDLDLANVNGGTQVTVAANNLQFAGGHGVNMVQAQVYEGTDNYMYGGMSNDLLIASLGKQGSTAMMTMRGGSGADTFVIGNNQVYAGNGGFPTIGADVCKIGVTIADYSSEDQLVWLKGDSSTPVGPSGTVVDGMVDPNGQNDFGLAIETINSLFGKSYTDSSLTLSQNGAGLKLLVDTASQTSYMANVLGNTIIQLVGVTDANTVSFVAVDQNDTGTTSSIVFTPGA